MLSAEFKRKYKHLKYLLFILPVMIPWLVLALYPNLQVFLIAFYKWNGISKVKEFVGLRNFKILLLNPDLPVYIANTLAYLFFLFFVQQTLALILALILKRKTPLNKFFRTLYFFPIVLSSAAVAMIWSYMYDTHLGVLNFLLGMIGAEPVQWLNTPYLTIFCAVVVQIWQGIGTQLVIYLAAIVAVPDSLYESAAMEGASPVQSFFKITLPMIVPTIIRLAFLTILSAFSTFEFLYLLFQWGTMSKDIITLPVYLFREVENSNVGIPSAIGFLLSAIMIVVFIIQLKISKKAEDAIY